MVISCRLSCKLGYHLELDVLYYLRSDLCILDLQGRGFPQATLICEKYQSKAFEKGRGTRRSKGQSESDMI